MVKPLHVLPLGMLLFAPYLMHSQTPLVAGDIAITGVNATANTVNATPSNKEFSFILLKDIAIGTSISFTDFGWRSDANAFQTANPCGSNPVTGAVTDGIVTWTATTAMTYGTQVLIRCQFAPTASVGNITAMQATFNSTGTATLSYVQMSTLGESLIAYTGSFSSPNLITAVKSASAGWQTTLLNCTADPTSSVRPPALTGNTAFVIPMVELTGNIRLKPNIIIPANAASALATIGNAGNWDMGSTPYPLPPANTVTPLPVTLISFTGVLTAGQSLLRWNVGSEVQVKRYVIERSKDGIAWQPIGELEAKNISGSSYQMTDFSPMPINFYRLKMEDIDGFVDYSHVISTRFSNAQQRTRVYPTKVTDHLTIETTDEPGLPITITDQLGRVVKRAQVRSFATTLTMAELATGFYQVRVGQQVFRVVK